MKIRFAPFGAILSVLAFFAWMSSGARNDPSSNEVEGTLAASVTTHSDDAPVLREQTGGSAVPCAVPLGWRIARVDGPFELSRTEAKAALDKAATLWEDAVGRSLFSNESEGTLPVRFAYDERQERTQERSRLVKAFNEATESLESRRKSLDAEREALMVRGRQIDGLQQRLKDDSERLDREVEAHRREGEALQATYPVVRVQSGTYREAVHTRDGKVTSVTREIRIYRFDGSDDLVRLAAHELGHAMGLGHSGVPGSLMSDEFVQTDLSRGAPRVQPADIEALRSVCPEL